MRQRERQVLLRRQQLDLLQLLCRVVWQPPDLLVSLLLRLESQQEEEASHLYTLPHTLQHTLQHMVLRQDEVLPRTLPHCPQMQQRRQ
mmetsp:Transcript_9812/g.14160  ORF Transcript_9812/g.14160 Transcript_9812/m.14160 type:complete len:88 (+) Transcript_9812:218-481(+)